MGWTSYLPPIQPLGSTNAKAETTRIRPAGDAAGPGRSGRRRAADAVAPELGALTRSSTSAGQLKDLAWSLPSTLAVQASYDHPWVPEHPDGSVAPRTHHRYAENPPSATRNLRRLHTPDPRRARAVGGVGGRIVLYGRTRGAEVPGTTLTPSRWLFWALLIGSSARILSHLTVGGVHRAQADAHISKAGSPKCTRL